MIKFERAVKHRINGSLSDRNYPNQASMVLYKSISTTKIYWLIITDLNPAEIGQFRFRENQLILEGAQNQSSSHFSKLIKRAHGLIRLIGIIDA